MKLNNNLINDVLAPVLKNLLKNLIKCNEVKLNENIEVIPEENQYLRFLEERADEGHFNSPYLKVMVKRLENCDDTEDLEPLVAKRLKIKCPTLTTFY